MSRDKLILLGVVVLALLGFFVWKKSKEDAELGKPVATSKDFPSISAPEDVDKITLQNGEKGEIVLEKVADPTAPPGDAGPATVWRVTKPVTARANQQTVKDLIANLKDLKVDSAINLKLDDEVRKDKQLDPAHGVHVTAWKAGEKKLDEIFGKGGAQQTTLLVQADKPEQVYAAKGYSSYLYTKDVKDYRDKEIVKFDDAAAAQITIVNSHGTLSFTKGDKWAGTFEKKPIEKFDEEKVKSMLTAYKALNGDDFGDNKTPADVGLDKPDATVTITLKDGAGKYEIQVGKVSSGTDHWAKRGSDDVVYQITNYAAEWATSDASKFQASADAGAPTGAAPKGSGTAVTQRFPK